MEAPGRTSAENPSTGLLIVDDEADVVDAVVRLLRPLGTRTFTATSGAQALNLLETHEGEIGAVLSDFHMPGVNGAELLHTARLRWPNVTRLLLTGNADVADAARAVNEGHLFRFLRKPWSPSELIEAVRDAIQQYELIFENERLRKLADEQAVHLASWNARLEEEVRQRTTELESANASLNRGVLESVRMMVQVLEWRVPERAAECREVARLAGRLAERSGLRNEEVRRVQVAALVHDVGLVSLPDAVLKQDSRHLSHASLAQYEKHPVLGHSLLSGVESLADMASWIRHHHERWDGHGYPDRLAGEDIPLPSRLIALANSYLQHVGGKSLTAIPWPRWQTLTRGAFDPRLVSLLEAEVNRRPGRPNLVLVDPLKLEPGMVLHEPLLLKSGTLVFKGGEPLSPEHIEQFAALISEGRLSRASVLAEPSRDRVAA